MAENNNKSSFWKIYRIVWIVLAIILVIFAIVFSSYLKKYEAAQPVHLAEETFNKYFKNFDTKSYDNLNASVGNEFEENIDISEYIDNLLKNGEVTYQKVSTGDLDSYKYIVKAGDVKFASFMLVEDTTKKGQFKSYKADNFEIFFDSNSNITIEAPSNYIVFINDKTVDESYITKKDIETEADKHMPEGVEPISYVRYKVKGFLSTPTVVVKDRKGNVASLEVVGSKYTASLVYDEDLKEEYNDYLITAIEKYAQYMQYDDTASVMGFGQISGYFDPSSDLYESIRTVENGFVIEYDRVTFEDQKTSEYISYSDDVFSARVTMTQILSKNGAVEDYKDYMDLTLYLRKVGDKFLIYDMAQN